MRPIVQLDPQLANQIAAGEVVERPASVVKELIENSLDAGADLIDVEILAGGTQLIRVRDNGHGIQKAQLTLALAPHATSKISELDDLSALYTFGFRGEALASISSVSKFSITSRTAEQEQGWSASCHGKAMQVEIIPAPATTGTRIDVAELFYNTPARRRFLRTEKTEFYQIDTVIKQAVLANPQVTFSLKHNQRLVKRYRAAHNEQQELERLTQILGKDFVKQAVKIDVEHAGHSLAGWIGMPSYHRSQTDGQFFYVNRRPVKDKVLTHALRQAYLNLIPEGRMAAYVLFLEIEPEQVDVNVHPTKHEVRFHAVRTVHDFIVQAMEQCISQGNELFEPENSTADHVASSVYKNYDETSGSESGAYRSYQSFISDAVQQVVAEDLPTMPHSLDGPSFIGILESGYVVLSEIEKLHLVDLNLLYSDNHKKTDSSLVFPEIIALPDNLNKQSFEKWLDTKEIAYISLPKQVKITAIPFACDVDVITDWLICWHAYENELLSNIPHSHWRWLNKQLSELQNKNIIQTIPISRLTELLQEHVDSK